MSIVKMYAATSVKRQKVAREATRPMENPETFQGVGRIEYKPDATFSCDEALSYRYYNATEKLHGRSMEEWLRPSVIYSSNMIHYTQQASTLFKPFENTNQARTMETTKKNIRAMFELCLKMGVKFWSGYEEELIPDGDTFEESQSNYEQISELLSEYQQKTGVKPLWVGVDFQNGRYANGAMTNPDANVVAFAGYQTKRALDMAQKLNAECFLIAGHRENYDNSMSTDLSKELKHYTRFLKLLIEHRDRIGFRGQLLFAYENVYSSQSINRANAYQPQFENCYSNSVFKSMLLLKHLNYDHYFKLNVRPGDEFNMANLYGCLGGIEVNTSQDVRDLANITLCLRAIVEKGGFGHGGITFNVPIYNFCLVEAKEVMQSYVNALDSYGKALRLVVKLANEAQINKQLQTRYQSFQSGWGTKFMTLDASLQDCEEIVKRLYETSAPSLPNKSHHWFVILQRYIDVQNVK